MSNGTFKPREPLQSDRGKIPLGCVWLRLRQLAPLFLGVLPQAASLSHSSAVLLGAPRCSD